MDDNEPTEFCVLGRMIGTCTRWEEDQEELTWFDYEPTDEARTVGLQAAKILTLNTAFGFLSSYDGNKTLWSVDAVDVLHLVKTCPFKEPSQ